MKLNRQAQIVPKITTVLMAYFVLSVAANDITAQPPKPDPESFVTNESVKQLQEDFLKLKFGMFIHYNMATYKGVQWVLGYLIPLPLIRAARSTPTRGRTPRYLPV